jgi:hypothetical protein
MDGARARQHTGATIIDPAPPPMREESAPSAFLVKKSFEPLDAPWVAAQTAVKYRRACSYGAPWSLRALCLDKGIMPPIRGQSYGCRVISASSVETL